MSMPDFSEPVATPADAAPPGEVAEAEAIAREALGISPDTQASSGEAVETPPAEVPATPAAETPAAPAEPAKVHPAWESALKLIPEELHPQILEQIRQSEVEAQKAIEKAREQTVPDEWRDLFAASEAAEANPAILINSYNAMVAMMEDPIQFRDSLNRRIDEMVAAGQLTPAQGEERKVDDTQADELLTDEQKEIRDLRKRLDEREQKEQTAEERRQQAAAEAQLEQEALTHATEFVSVINAEVGLPANVSEDAVPPAVNRLRFTIAQLANDALSKTPGLTIQQAVAGARAQLTALGAGAVPAAPAPAAASAPPIGGGTSGIPAAAAKGFKTEAEREAAMIEAARLMLAGG